ncbi:hypothetical protein FKM82_030270 [Ascaphus truei]
MLPTNARTVAMYATKRRSVLAVCLYTRAIVRSLLVSRAGRGGKDLLFLMALPLLLARGEAPVCYLRAVLMLNVTLHAQSLLQWEPATLLLTLQSASLFYFVYMIRDTSVNPIEGMKQPTLIYV